MPATKRGGGEAPGREAQATQRMMDLLFALSNARTPLSTSAILSNSDIGYGSDKRDSDLKKFRRDRAQLAEAGIVIREANAAGAAENEESRWEIDRARTFAEAGLVSCADAELLLDAIDAQRTRRDLPFLPVLDRVRGKVARLATGVAEGPDGWGAQDARDADPVLDTLWDAFSRRRAIRISYRDGRGRESERELRVYGIVSLEGHVYTVGLDGASGEVRTFRADRIARAKAVRGGNAAYEVPANFSAADHLFLPFDLGGGEAVAATFTFPAGTTDAELATITRGRGRLVRGKDAARWEVEVRDIEAAAALALRNAHRGMRPQAPTELIEAWNDLIERTVGAHAERP